MYDWLQMTDLIFLTKSSYLDFFFISSLPSWFCRYCSRGFSLFRYVICLTIHLYSFGLVFVRFVIFSFWSLLLQVESVNFLHNLPNVIRVHIHKRRLVFREVTDTEFTMCSKQKNITHCHGYSNANIQKQIQTEALIQSVCSIKVSVIVE